MSNRRKIRATPTWTTAQTFWNGLSTSAVRGTAVIADDGRFPEYWARAEGLIGTRVPVVRVVLDGVNYGGGTAYLDNRDGSGWRKVTEGRGGPNYSSRSVDVEPGSFVRGVHVTASGRPAERGAG